MWDEGFIKTLLEANIPLDYHAIDVSLWMIRLAKENFNKNNNIKLFVAEDFNTPINDKTKFEIINLDSVLHYLVDKTRGECG